MTPLAVAFLVAAVAVAAIDWWSVARDAAVAEYLAKPLVMVCLVGAAMAIDASDDTARGLVVAALGASLVGDVVLLTPDGPLAGGLGAFLVAHILYATALADSVQTEAAIAGAIVVVGLSLGVVPQLLAAVRPHGAALTAAVSVYSVAVATTAVMAVGTRVLVAAAGGLLFLVSDALVGWRRFIGPSPGGRTLAHLTYHLGQTGLVVWLAV